MSMLRFAHRAFAQTAAHGASKGSMRLMMSTPGMASMTHTAVYRHMCTQTRDVKAAIENAVKSKPLVLFMKGVPEAPQCGFSNAVIQVLGMHGVTEFPSFNVLEDQELRQAIKEYSDWPTIPQIYINGEFVGGCDILISMHKSGELVDVLKEAGIESTMKYEEEEDKK